MIVPLIYASLAGASFGAPILNFMTRYLKSKFGNNRPMSALGGMADKLGAQYDPRSSASLDQLQEIAKSKFPNSFDTDQINQMTEQLRQQNVSSTNKRGYDGKYQ